MTDIEAMEVLQNRLDWAAQNQYPFVGADEVEAIKIAIDLLNKPKKKNGKWIKWNVDITFHPLHCSVCDWSNYHIRDSIVEDFDFCPNCGRKMEKEW